MEYAYGRERPWHLTRVHTSYFILNYNNIMLEDVPDLKIVNGMVDSAVQPN